MGYDSGVRSDHALAIPGDPNAGPAGLARAANSPRWGLAIALLGAICYANTLVNDFTYDDELVVARSERIRSLSNWREIWLDDWWEIDKDNFSERSADRLYRPLPVFTFALNYALGEPGEMHPFDYHLVNLLLHAATSGLVWLLVRRLSGEKSAWSGLAAASTGVLFAVHPIHVETVASAVGRADLLAAISVVGGLLFFLSDRQRPRWSTRIGVVACFATGLFSKESGIILVAWMLICELWFRRSGVDVADAAVRHRSWRRVLTLYPPLAVVFAGYLVLRYFACDGMVLQAGGTGLLDNPLTEGTLAERIWTPFKLMGFYLGLMFWPATLSCDYSYRALPLADSPLEPWVAFGLALSAAGVVTLALTWKRRHPAGLAVLLFAGGYAMFSNGPKLIGTIFGERLFYIPSIPTCWLIGMAVAHFGLRAQRAAARGAARGAHVISPARYPLGWWIVLAAVTAALSARTFIRNLDWRNNDTLFATALRAYPESARIQYAYGKVLLLRGRVAEAIPYLKRAVRICPRMPGFYYDLSQAHWALRHMEEAEQAAAMAVTLNGAVRSFNENLADIQRLIGRDNPSIQRSLPAAQAWAAEHPDDAEAQYALGLAWIHAGRPPRAVEALQRAVALDPAREDARLELSAQLIVVGRLSDALTELTRVVEQSPNNWRAHTNLAIVLARSLRPAEAIEHARTANRLAPGRIETWFNLAQTLGMYGQRDEALSIYRSIRDGLPENDPQRALIEGYIQETERRKP
jgi:tetratricopeptide (TPR) repeat protein